MQTDMRAVIREKESLEREIEYDYQRGREVNPQVIARLELLKELLLPPKKPKMDTIMKVYVWLLVAILIGIIIWLVTYGIQVSAKP